MGWMHRHTQEMFPTQPVYRGGPVRELEYNTIPAISDASIETPQGPMPFRRFLASDQSTAMGVVILYQGQIAFESYPRMREYEKVTYWSTTKILAGAIVRLLEEQGRIDISQPIEAFVPQLASSVHAGTTIENILDMATGVDCAENYTTLTLVITDIQRRSVTISEIQIHRMTLINFWQKSQLSAQMTKEKSSFTRGQPISF